MGKWFAPNAVRGSHGLERKKPKEHSAIVTYVQQTQQGTTSQSKHTVKYPDLPSAMNPVPHNEECPVPKPPENLTFNDENSDSD